MDTLPSIGIIGGAGPEAGALLFKQVIRICQKKYGCQRDYEFPLIHLLSYPFAEMLGKDPDSDHILSQVKDAYNRLDTDFVVIACNTLHTFLDQTFCSPRFIHLIEQTAHSLNGTPTVLCSTTSKKQRVHERFFPCVYPDLSLQKEVDTIIDRVLENGPEDVLQDRIIEIIQHIDGNEVILGCTELSLIHDEHPIEIEGVSVIDPSWKLAEKLGHLIFKKGEVR